MSAEESWRGDRGEIENARATHGKLSAVGDGAGRSESEDALVDGGCAGVSVSGAQRESSRTGFGQATRAADHP